MVRGNITINYQVTYVAFKNCALFTKCITAIDDAESLDLVMPMYNLLEYSTNYFETTGSLCFILKMKQLILMQILPTQIL